MQDSAGLANGCWNEVTVGQNKFSMTEASKPRLVLASASLRRLQLLERIGVEPDAVVPADVDESVPKGERPRDHALRLAREKAEAVAPREPEALVLAADTVVAVGRRILPKVEDEETLRACMKLLSGRRHRVLTGVALAIPGRGIRERLVETMIAMKRLTSQEIDHYASHGEWRGKAGGYALQGYGEVFVRHIAGSYSNVVGLPLAETRHLLRSADYPIA